MGYPNCPLEHSIPNYAPKMFLVTRSCSYVIVLSEIFAGRDCHVKGSELSCSEKILVNFV